MGPKILAACKKAAIVNETNENEANEKEVIIQAIGS